MLLDHHGVTVRPQQWLEADAGTSIEIYAVEQPAGGHACSFERIQRSASIAEAVTCARQRFNRLIAMILGDRNVAQGPLACLVCQLLGTRRLIRSRTVPARRSRSEIKELLAQAINRQARREHFLSGVVKLLFLLAERQLGSCMTSPNRRAVDKAIDRGLRRSVGVARRAKQSLLCLNRFDESLPLIESVDVAAGVVRVPIMSGSAEQRSGTIPTVDVSELALVVALAVRSGAHLFVEVVISAIELTATGAIIFKDVLTAGERDERRPDLLAVERAGVCVQQRGAG